MTSIILASGSPRRRDLLNLIHLPFEVVISGADERVSAQAPSELVQLLSQRKAAAVAAEHPDRVVVAADTIVYLDGEVLGKPQDAADAARMLRRLSGRAHIVYTGYTVQQGSRVVTDLAATTVHFRPLDDAEIDRYVASGEPMDKAGAYAVQGGGARFVTGIEGDFYNVIGLPLCQLVLTLRQFGIDA